MSMSPFDYLNSINKGTPNMMRGTDNDELAEKEYNAFLVNRGLSYFPDTIAAANEMNRLNHLDKKLQYEFLLNNIRPRKRFSKWAKKTEDNNLELIKEYFSFNDDKALRAVEVLSDNDIEKIKIKLEKGGKT